MKYANRVLYVDDDEELREMLADYFAESIGSERVDTASDYQEGFACYERMLAEQGHYRVVVLDGFFPGSSLSSGNPELTRAIQSLGRSLSKGVYVFTSDPAAFAKSFGNSLPMYEKGFSESLVKQIEKDLEDDSYEQ